MLKRTSAFIFALLLISLAGNLIAQTPAIKPSVIAGDVVSIGNDRIAVAAKTGTVEVQVNDKTQIRKVSAENPDFKTAAAGTLADIGVGDKLTVTGILSADGKTLPARSVYFMTKADIAKKNAKEAEEWRVRGITGKVTAVNAQTGQLTIETRSLAGSSNVTLTPKDTAKFLRYAPDSIRFDEAKESTLSEVKVGDMLRALGDKSSDGLSFAAEKVITGAFQTVAGTIKSVDPEKREIVIKNLQTNKDVTVTITDTSVLKKYPAEMAERFASFQGGAGMRPAGGQGRPAQPAAGQPQGGGRPSGFGGGMGGGARGGNIDEMLDRFPAITAADLKVGDMIAISSTRTANVERMNAIKLLAGVEPFLRMAQGQNGGRGGRGGQGQDFNIPGLDSIGFP